MCGIAGVAGGLEPGDARRRLEAMVASMHHRGPDDRGVEVAADGERTVGICATRLAIQDCSPNGHQPMLSRRSGACLAFNGELYNVGDLRAELAARGHAFRGTSDTEVVLAAFDEWGLDCLARLRGMFGLAVWDPARRRLCLARDRLGIKPLYYAERDGALIFGSEVRTVLASGLVERRLSTPAVASFLASGAVEEPLTIIDGVRTLGAGEYAVWQDARLSGGSYWSLARAFAGGGRRRPRDEVVAELRAGLEDAVARHLVSDVPLGVFLSGGIDSSALAALVAHVAGEPPRTVSVVFPDAEFSEERYIRLMAGRVGSDHTDVRLTGPDFRERLDGAVRDMDQPTFDGVNTYVVSAAAREAGLTVALSGLGGDELFAGYSSFRDVPRLEALRAWIPRPLGAPAARVARSVTRASDRGEKLARWLGDPASAASGYELMRELFAPEVRAQLLGGAGGAAPPPLPPSVEADAVNRVSYLELSRYMRNVLLRDSDVMSMAHSLEVRVPLLDHTLVELAARVPGRDKVAGGRPKGLLVEALGELLPSEVVDRPKMGFTFPFANWLRNGLGGEVGAKLGDPAYGGAVAAALDPAAIGTVWTRFQEGRAYWARPWALFVLKSWCERHLPA